MEHRGTKLTIDSGPTIKELMEAGFDPEFRVEPLPRPAIVPGHGVFFTKAILTLLPERSPATRSKDPVGAEVYTNMPLEAFAQELSAGRSQLRDTYAERCAVEAAEMIRKRVPGVLRG